jgi:hypothetical protein
MIGMLVQTNIKIITKFQLTEFWINQVLLYIPFKEVVVMNLSSYCPGLSFRDLVHAIVFSHAVQLC